jgi:2-amino-4-hydroxy-6-hydroxymethyldihydropteridine diphosphokinase
MPRCCIGLGGNLGDVAATFRSALRQLADSGHSVLAISRLYATAAVGPDAGNAFHNACALIETTLSPWGLLDAIHELEDAAGRDRSVRWGARTLDVDILTYDELVLNDPVLTLPHPGVVYRRFVLDPLLDVAPQMVHPVSGRTIADLQQRLRVRPLPIRLFTGSEAVALRLIAELRERFRDAVDIEIDLQRDSSLDPTCLLLHGLPAATGGLRSEMPAKNGAVCVELDRQLAAHNPLAAAVAVVTAMLDEPRVVGAL